MKTHKGNQITLNGFTSCGPIRDASFLDTYKQKPSHSFEIQHHIHDEKLDLNEPSIYFYASEKFSKGECYRIQSTSEHEWSEWSFAFKDVAINILKSNSCEDVKRALEYKINEEIIIKLMGAIECTIEGLSSFELFNSKFKKSLINILKHYPDISRYSKDISISIDSASCEFVLQVFPQCHNTDGTYINMQFESNGNIAFYSKDYDSSDRTYFLSGTIHTSKVIRKSYKINHILSFLHGGG